MLRILLRVLVFLGSAALGLLAAAWLLPAVDLSPVGFVTAVVVFAVAQSLLVPVVSRIAARAAPAFLGGIGLVSTVIALFVATLFPNGLHITGWRAWVLAPVVVWLVTALATLVLSPFVPQPAHEAKPGPRGRRAR
jgi:hypothetical protein